MSITKPNRDDSPHKSASVERTLDAYGLMATAAGVGLLVFVPPASAEIVYTPSTFTVTLGTRFIDVDGDGVGDFVIADQFFPPNADFPIIGRRKLDVRGQAGAAVATSHLGAAALFSGDVIGSSHPFVDVHQEPALMVGGVSYYVGSTGTCCFSPSGNWQNLKQRYLGLKFTINGETHYGWARFSVKLPFEVTAPIKATLLGFAYETNPNQSIIAGDTGTNSSPNFKPRRTGTLGTLALGAAGK